MDLKTYIKALKARITTSPPDLDNEDSVLGILYEAYSECNRLEDDRLKADFNELYRQMNGMTLREMDHILDPVCSLCRDHERIGFVNGIKLGFILNHELNT